MRHLFKRLSTFVSHRNISISFPSWFRPVAYYAFMLGLVATAVTSPTAAASGSLTDDATNALAILAPLAVLLFWLVYSVWKQTFRNAPPSSRPVTRTHAGAPLDRD